MMAEMPELDESDAHDLEIMLKQVFPRVLEKAGQRIREVIERHKYAHTDWGAIEGEEAPDPVNSTPPRPELYISEPLEAPGVPDEDAGMPEMAAMSRRPWPEHLFGPKDEFIRQHVHFFINKLIGKELEEIARRHNRRVRNRERMERRKKRKSNRKVPKVPKE